MKYKLKHNKGLYKFFTMFICLVFILASTNISVLANEIIGVNAKDQGIVKKKISKEVLNAFENHEYVKVLVEFHDKVNVFSVANEAINNMSKNATKYEKNISKKFAVINELQKVAKESQQNIISYLDNEMQKGQVKEYKSFYIVNIVAVTCTNKVVEEIAANSQVKSIVMDSKIEQNWPKVKDITSIDTIQNAEWGINKVKATEVWENYGIKGSGVVVGIIDTGFDHTHEALKTKWRGYNAENPSNPNVEGNWFDAVTNKPLPYDEPLIPHGSHVTGTIVGQSGENIIGVAPEAKFIVARAFNAESGQDSWILEAGEWMLAPGGNPENAPSVINNSWSGGPGLDEWYREMVQAWRATGILPVFAASNEPDGVPAPPGSIGNPGNYPEAFAVGAVDINNIRGIFSRRGPAPYEAPNDLKPDITAPGVNVRSSVPGGYEGGWDGTSMATPHVAGVAALLLSANPSLTPDEIEQAIIGTATPLTDSTYEESPNYGYGYGIVNALEAVKDVTNGSGIIEGEVFTEGEDSQSAKIVDYTVRENGFKGVPIPIKVTVTDNIAITKVELYVSQNGNQNKMLMPLEKLSGNHKEAVYGATIPGELVVNPSISYEIAAYDYGKNQTKTESIKVNVKFGVLPNEFNYNFTDKPVDWTEISGDWEWGEISAKEPVYDAGNKVIGTNLKGDYSNDTQSWLISPPIDLRECEGIYLSYDYYFDTYMPDFSAVLITNDYGKTWATLKEYTVPEKLWKRDIIKTEEFANSEEPVFIAFVMASNTTISRVGLYLDNIVVGEKNTVAPHKVDGLASEITSAGVGLKWNKSSEVDVVKYKIYREEVGGNPILMLETTQTTLLDSSIESNKSYNYYVTAIDVYENESHMSDPLLFKTPIVQVAFEEKFDHSNGGFVSNNELLGWQWGVPTGRLEPYGYGKLWGTNLQGNYESNGKYILESTEIDLTNISNPILTLKEYIDTEKIHDKTRVEIFSHNQWKLLRELKSRTERWDTSAIPLSEYAGETVKLRFVLTSDSSLSRLGWYIDDIRILSIEGQVEAGNWYDAKTESELVNEKLSREDLETTQLKIEERTLDNQKDSIKVEGYIPVEAVVTVTETGKTTFVDPVTGKYTLRHAANLNEGEQWTVKVYQYGYNTETQRISLNGNETKNVDFKLTKTPTASVKGTIVNERTGKPIVGAYIKLVEDTRIKPVYTDENGKFDLQNVLEGQWTLLVEEKSYITKTITIERKGINEVDTTINIKPFVGYKEEISYDDGEEENAMAVNTAGGGLAKRITSKYKGMLKGIKVKVYDTTWPLPGGTELKIAIMECKKDNTPGEILYITEPIQVVRGQWNTIDLSQFNYNIQGDFFLATVQTNTDSNSPGIGIDESSEEDGRNFIFSSGRVQAFESTDGNIMIRALVEQGLNIPSITSHTETSYTNQETVQISGTVNGDCKVKIYVNNEEVAKVETKNQNFEVIIPLSEGNNKIKATALIDSIETDPTSITIIKDSQVPIVEIQSPRDNYNSNKESVELIGKVTEEHLDKVTVNHKEVTVHGDGVFETKVIAPQGKNVITVVATDLVGNESVTKIIVNTNLNGPSIYEIEPKEDKVVSNGEELTVSFRSNLKGGKATFKLNLTTNSINKQDYAIMNEVEPGYYVGKWIIPDNLSFTNGTILLALEDQYGNVFESIAPGKISTIESLRYPIEIIDLQAREQFGTMLIEGTVQNISNITVKPTMIIVVQDNLNRVTNISLAKISRLKPGKIVKLGTGFEKPAIGNYKVKAFIWNDLDLMDPLSNPREITIEVK